MRYRHDTHYYVNAAVASLSFLAIMSVIAAPLFRFSF
jgi:hypothetical protein